MKPHQFQPTGVDALEDRLVMSTIVPPVIHAEVATTTVNPKFLNLTGRTEHAIVNGITAAFAHFSVTYHGGSPTDATPILAFTKLNKDVLAIAHKIPFGGTSLYPTLASLTTGSGGTNPKTGNSAISLQAALTVDSGLNYTPGITLAISTYETIIRQTINNYVHQEAISGQIHLVRGATLPPLTGTGAD